MKSRYAMLDKVAGLTATIFGLFLALYGLAKGTFLPLYPGVDPFWFRIGQILIGALITYAGAITEGVGEMFGVTN